MDPVAHKKGRGDPAFRDASKWPDNVNYLYRNVFSHTPRNKMRQVSAVLKAIHAQESREAAFKKASKVVEDLKAMRPGKSAVVLVAARLGHIASSKWGVRKYVSMDWLKKHQLEVQHSA